MQCAWRRVAPIEAILAALLVLAVMPGVWVEAMRASLQEGALRLAVSALTALVLVKLATLLGALLKAARLALREPASCRVRIEPGRELRMWQRLEFAAPWSSLLAARRIDGAWIVALSVSLTRRLFMALPDAEMTDAEREALSAALADLPPRVPLRAAWRLGADRL